MKKITIFTGHCGGDGECFRLEDDKVKEIEQLQRKIIADPDKFMELEKELDKHQLYPNALFPEKCRLGTWKFKITVEITKKVSK